MPGVGQQGQAARDQRADHLDDEHGGGEGEHDREPTPVVLGTARGAAVCVRVPAAHRAAIAAGIRPTPGTKRPVAAAYVRYAAPWTWDK